MRKNNRKFYLKLTLISFVICIIIPIVFMFFMNNGSVKTSAKNEADYYTNYINTHENIINNIIKNRKAIILESNILIGENEKQLENGYFDVCIGVKSYKCNVIINKLLKSNILNGDDVVDDNYLKEIINFVLDVFNINLKDVEKEVILNNVKMSYLTLRNAKNMDNLVADFKSYDFNAGNYNFHIDLYNNMLSLDIWR